MKFDIKLIAIVLTILLGTGLFYLNLASQDTVDLPETVSEKVVSQEKKDLPDATLDINGDQSDEVLLTKEEVEKNNDASSCWTIINQNVYDITSYIPNHPGGEAAISSICGREGTAQFERQPNHNSLADQNLQRLLLGPLQE